MKVVVDTSVWSLALRRTGATDRAVIAAINLLDALLLKGDSALLGAVRQELLAGIRDPAQFRTLRSHLRAFPDVPLESEDYEQAAKFSNDCRAAGVQGSSIDFLICAVAWRRGMAILTTDRDFSGFAKVIPVRLHQ